MNGVIMVLASITLTIAMSFATVPRRHRRIQRADPSRQKFLDMEKIISGGFGRSLFFFYAKGPRAEYDDDGAGQSQMTSPS